MVVSKQGIAANLCFKPIQEIYGIQSFNSSIGTLALTNME